MANLVARMKTYNFWISLVSAIILVLRIVGDKFNFFVDATLIMDITTGLCGIFVVLGIISAPAGKKEEIAMEANTQNAIGRFEQILVDNAEKTNESIEEIIEDTAEENIAESKEEIEIKFENETENVENVEILEEKIQQENEIDQNEVERAVDVIAENAKENTVNAKTEIAEILTILIDKINSL